MNIAYIILCHKKNKILEETIKILANEGENDIYIHVDKKSNIAEFDSLRDKKVVFLKNRVDVRWGGQSQIEATLNLLKATETKNYDYIFFISGDDLPLKSSTGIKRFLEKNKGYEFIGIQNNKDNNSSFLDRVRLNYSSVYFKKEKNILDKIIIKFHLKSKNKYFKYLPPLYKGPQWFGITSDARDFIFKYLGENPYYSKAFEKSLCGDEIFFQTILMNSKFKDKIYKYGVESDDNLMALRYIDWKKGPDFPRTLDESDYDDILKTEALFARKFNDNIDLENYRKVFVEKNRK